MPNSDDFLVVAKILVAKDQNSCSVTILSRLRVNEIRSREINYSSDSC